MAGPFKLMWPVAEGYDLFYPGAPEDEPEPAVIYARGGPVRYYEPLEVDGLWRKFAEQCRPGAPDGDAGTLAFVRQYGLLDVKPPPPLFKDPSLGEIAQQPLAAELEELPLIEGPAYLLWRVRQELDGADRAAAADLLSAWGRAKVRIDVRPRSNGAGVWEQRYIPASLYDALLCQAAEAIAHNHEWRRCRNERCSEWFRIGGVDSAGHKINKRREFCSTRCRVAVADRRAAAGVHRA